MSLFHEEFFNRFYKKNDTMVLACSLIMAGMLGHCCHLMDQPSTSKYPTPNFPNYIISDKWRPKLETYIFIIVKDIKV